MDKSIYISGLTSSAWLSYPNTSVPLDWINLRETEKGQVVLEGGGVYCYRDRRSQFVVDPIVMDELAIKWLAARARKADSMGGFGSLTWETEINAFGHIQPK